MSAELREQVLGLVKELVISVGLFFVASTFMEANTLQAFFIACIPYGWGILNKIQPTMFLFLPFVGWLIYFIVKATLAIFVGVFAMPYTLIKCSLGVVRAYRNQQ